MPRKLFVADDDEGQREMILTAAEQAHFQRAEVCVVASPEKAHSVIDNSSEPFSLAVVDLRLAGGESIRPGLEVIKHLRDKFDLCVVIALTNDHPNVGKQAIWAGASDFVSIKEFAGWRDASELATPGRELWVHHLRDRLLLWLGVNEPFLAGTER